MKRAAPGRTRPSAGPAGKGRSAGFGRAEIRNPTNPAPQPAVRRGRPRPLRERRLAAGCRTRPLRTQLRTLSSAPAAQSGPRAPGQFLLNIAVPPLAPAPPARNREAPPPHRSRAGLAGGTPALPTSVGPALRRPRTKPGALTVFPL